MSSWVMENIFAILGMELGIRYLDMENLIAILYSYILHTKCVKVFHAL